jgi:type IV secretory pathway VirD2 relaxase
MNDDKTQGKLLVSGFRCAAATAETDFYITEKMAKAHSRKDTTNIGGSDIKAYHMIQSFSKNEKLTAEKAHELGEELAREFLGGKYEYVLTTHVDKGHIHNHIVFNAYSQDDAKKFRTVPYKTAERLRDISDGICEKSGLLVLENAKGAGYGHWEWEERNKGSS